LLRTFYSLQDMKTPMINASIAVGFNILLNLILSKYMGISGLALATSLSALISTSLLCTSLRKKIGPLGLKSIGVTVLKVTVASSVMGLVIALLNGYVGNGLNELLKMAVIVVIGCASYFILLTVLKVEESKIIFTFIRKKVRL